MRAAPTATPGEPPPPPPSPTSTSYPIPQPTPTPVAPTGHDDVPMIEIPAGEFVVGSTFDDAAYRSWVYYEEKRDWFVLSSRFNDEGPQLTVYLDTFEIDQVEVTNARYRRCVDVGICPPGEPPDQQRDEYPAIVPW
jgi:formylglycine-generating enzyme required for sulfatase activity